MTRQLQSMTKVRILLSSALPAISPCTHTIAQHPSKFLAGFLTKVVNNKSTRPMQTTLTVATQALIKIQRQRKTRRRTKKIFSLWIQVVCLGVMIKKCTIGHLRPTSRMVFGRYVTVKYLMSSETSMAMSSRFFKWAANAWAKLKSTSLTATSPARSVCKSRWSDRATCRKSWPTRRCAWCPTRTWSRWMAYPTSTSSTTTCGKMKTKTPSPSHYSSSEERTI